MKLRGVILLFMIVKAHSLSAQQTQPPVMDQGGSCAREKFGAHSGNVVVSLRVDVTGQPSEVAAVSADFDDLVPCAVEIAQTSVFRPALRDGKPIPARIRFQVHVERR